MGKGVWKVKINSLVFYFRYYPTKPYKRYIGMLLGIGGSLIGLSTWLVSFLSYDGEHSGTWDIYTRAEYTIFLFLPSSIALIAAFFQKNYLMWLSFLLSTPIIVSTPGTVNNLSLFYLPGLCFFVSSLFMRKISLSKKDKEELEKIIFDEVKMIENEVIRRLSDITLAEEPLLNRDRKKLTTFMIARIYQLNIRFAKDLKRNYENYKKSRGEAFANTYRLGVFYYITRSNGIWDLKRIIGDGTIYTFRGEEKNGEYIGNHHFGYMGSAAGFSCNMLRITAGMYQVYSRTSHWKYLFSYFDHPEDSNAIADGCTDYVSGYRF
ncbi:hypothetical protein CWO92_17985 [Heyndrickxia camelliae]|uniref:Uncharacterized protein n=1 Tax=Heyndrickxia camelliae TaxID=1707093 RepID=A0A2N3LGI4_9BACI|nr:hypothetical protein CWO92_17985 [Heyndrickxia camelliae]